MLKSNTCTISLWEYVSRPNIGLNFTWIKELYIDWAQRFAFTVAYCLQTIFLWTSGVQSLAQVFIVRWCQIQQLFLFIKKSNTESSSFDCHCLLVKVDNQKNWCWLESHLSASILLAVMFVFELKWQCNQAR